MLLTRTIQKKLLLKILLKTIFAFVFFSTYTYANFPACTPIKIKSLDKKIILKKMDPATQATIYFIKNTSDKGIWLDHTKENVGASAGWNSFLRSGNWSAIKIDEKNFALSCSIISPGKVDQLDCSQNITICIPEKISYDKSKKGSYWLAEDMDEPELIKAMKARGYNLK